MRTRVGTGAATGNVMITNTCRQMIPLQVKPPKGDFYYEEHQIRLNPGQSVTLPTRYLNLSQIENCKSRGNIRTRDEQYEK